MNTGPESPQAQLVAYRQELAHTAANDKDNSERTKTIKAAISENEAAVKAEIKRLQALLAMDDRAQTTAEIDALQAVLAEGREGEEPETTTKAPVAERATRKTAKKGT